MKSKKYNSFEELALGIKYDEEDEFLDLLTSGERDKAFDYIEMLTLADLQKHPQKEQISLILYEKFKLHFSSQDFNFAKTLINKSYDVYPHDDLVKQRRSLFSKRTNKIVNPFEKSQKIITRPQIKEPYFKQIEASHSLGTYKWRGDIDRKEHKWTEMIVMFKEGDSNISTILGEILGDFILKKTDLLKICDIIVPIPGEPKRSFDRGIDIMQGLALGVQNILAMPIINVYLGRKISDHSKNLSKNELMSSYFAVTDKVKQIKNKHILLIDDICTSGKTLDTCAKILLDGGAKAVYSVVLARAESTLKRLDSTSSSAGPEKVLKLAYWYCLSATEKLGPVKTNSLFDNFGNAQKILKLSEEDLTTVRGIGSKIAKAIVNQSDKVELYKDSARKQIEISNNIKSKIITFENLDYPKLLKNSKFPVPVLYTRGKHNTLTSLNNTVAIVGSRDIHTESILFIQKIVQLLVMNEWAVISGMAKGVDGTSHKNALMNGGLTIGVLANGVDQIYPPENKELYWEMIKQGLLASEYKHGQPVTENRLRRRNKLIVAFSKAVIIVQTTESGGALNAVRAAKEENKPVFIWNDERLLNKKQFNGNKYLLESEKYVGINLNNLLSILDEYI